MSTKEKKKIFKYKTTDGQTVEAEFDKPPKMREALRFLCEYARRAENPGELIDRLREVSGNDYIYLKAISVAMRELAKTDAETQRLTVYWVAVMCDLFIDFVKKL